MLFYQKKLILSMCIQWQNAESSVHRSGYIEKDTFARKWY